MRHSVPKLAGRDVFKEQIMFAGIQTNAVRKWSLFPPAFCVKSIVTATSERSTASKISTCSIRFASGNDQPVQRVRAVSPNRTPSCVS